MILYTFSSNESKVLPQNTGEETTNNVNIVNEVEVKAK